MRAFDLFISSLTLAILSPLMLVVIIILRFTGEGYIFFLQKRIGKNGFEFNLIKFVTMLKDSPNIGSRTLTLYGDDRILRFGTFLRRTKLNELPQLLNVIKGDMSLIGPRPQTPECFSKFELESQEIIKTVKPGISGIGSLVFSNEEDVLKNHKNPELFFSEVLMPYKGRTEEWFVKNISLNLYFALLIKTIMVVLFNYKFIPWTKLHDFPKPNFKI